MNPSVKKLFPTNYAMNLLQDLPGSSLVEHRFYPCTKQVGQDGIMISVEPKDAPPWVGTFAFGNVSRAGCNQVLSMPNPNTLCVISQGAGRAVVASQPDTWEEIPLTPIVEALQFLDLGLVVFVGWTHMLAYNKLGITWRTKRLAWDGLEVVSSDSKRISGKYWDVCSNSEALFEVDLLTGDCVGGVEA